MICEAFCGRTLPPCLCVPALPRELRLHPSCILRIFCSLAACSEWAEAAVQLDQLESQGCQAPKPKAVRSSRRAVLCMCRLWGCCKSALCLAPGTAQMRPRNVALPRSAALCIRRATRGVQAGSWQQLAQRAAVLAGLRERGDLFGLRFALRVDYQRHAGKTTSRWAAALGGPVAGVLELLPCSSWPKGAGALRLPGLSKRGLAACLPACL